jgi:hypothetical protein
MMWVGLVYRESIWMKFGQKNWKGYDQWEDLSIGERKMQNSVQKK